MIIDGHCHAREGRRSHRPLGYSRAARTLPTARGESLKALERTVLLAVFHSDYTAANRQVARIVASRPHRFYGFACVHPDRDRGGVHALIKIAVETIRLSRHQGAPHATGRITRRGICEVARPFSLPVLYDVMGEVSVVELLAKEYPEVSFIIPHLGSFADDWRAQLALVDHLIRHPNAYAETSGVRRFDLLEQAVRRAGGRKIIFGSDGPWLHPGVELAKVLGTRFLYLAAEGAAGAG